MSSRREFLKAAAAAGGWLAFRGLVPPLAQAANPGRFPEGTWGGNLPTWCHDVLRDGGSFTKVAPSRKAAVVVVGGGLAGLCAAWKLRDTDVVLLEHLDRIGGHAVRDRWNDIWYSGAGAYFVEPEAPLDALYDEMKLPLVKIAEPADSAILNWNAVTDTFGAGLGKLPYPKRIRDDFARARKDFEEILESDDCPVMPLADTTGASHRFDTLTFADWMLKEKKYHPAVKAYVDLYCRSAFAAPSSEHLSAFAGLNFYVSEFSDRYALPGGNAVAAEILRDAIDAAGANRILPAATAVAIETGGSNVVVTYLDRSGRPAAIEAKAVVMAAPKYVARRIVKGLPEDQVAAMAELRYGSYVVANVLCRAPITQESYDTWTDSAPFTDFIVADWITRKPGEPKRTGAQVLTVYYPVDYQTALLLSDASYDTFRDAVADHVELLFPGSLPKIEDVRLNRWAHAMCHASPGWYTKRSTIASRTFGRVVFGHSDNQGLPAFEAALVEGMNAAATARELVAS